MDPLLDKLDAQFSELVSRISHLDKLDDQPSKIAALDLEFVDQVTYIKKQFEAGKKLEKLRTEGKQLDNSLNNILMELAQCRRDLEKCPKETDALINTKVNETDLLEYATKITKFTQRMPGNADTSILPWPAEDQLRRGMLATLTVQSEMEQADMSIDHQPHIGETNYMAIEQPTVPEGVPEPAQVQQSAESRPIKTAPKQKISLDFDSDDD